MGFFSWDCRECGTSVWTELIAKGTDSWRADAVVVLSDESVLKGRYSGYGEVGGFDLMEGDVDVLGANPPDFYHERCWRKAGKPQEYRGGSRSARDQGFFIGLTGGP